MLVGTFKRSVGVMETAEIRLTRFYYTYNFKNITKLYTVSVEEIWSRNSQKLADCPVQDKKALRLVIALS